MRREPTIYLVPRGPEWRTICVRYKIVHRQISSTGLKPAHRGADIFIPFIRSDGAIQRMFKQPVKFLRWLVLQEIGELEGRLKSGFGRFFGCDADGARCQVKTKRLEAGLGKLTRIMA